MSPQQQGQLRIAAPKPVYSALHHRSFVLQDVRLEGELSPAGEPREPERSGEPTRTSAFSPSSDSTEGLTAFHQNQQPPQQQLPVQSLSHPQEMTQSHPLHPPPSHSQVSSRTHNSSLSFAKSRMGSKTPPVLFNPTSTDSSRQGQIKKPSSLGYPAPSPPLSGGRPLPSVPLASQDSTSSSDISHRSATHLSMTTGAGSTWPRSSASSTSSTSSKSPHTHLSFSTSSTRTMTPPSLISTAAGSSTAFPMSSDIMVFDGDKANNGGRGGSGGNTVHGTQAQGSHVQSTQGTKGAQGVTYSYAFHQDQNQSTSSSSSSVLFASAALSSPAFVTSPSPLSPPPPPPLPAAMAASPASGHVPSASVAMTGSTTKSGGSSMEGAGNWSVSKDGRGNNPNIGTAANNSNSSKINSANNSGSSINSNTALIRPLPLPPGSIPRARTRSNNAINVLGGPPGSHTSSVNVLSLPISWASRPVDLNRSVPASSSVNAGHSGGEHQQHQQHTSQQHQQQQPGQQIQQGQGPQQKTYSRPPSRPSLRSSRPPSRSSRPSSPSAPSPPPRPPSNLAFGPSSSTTSSTSGAARSRSPPPRSKTITSTTRRGVRLRSRSTSRPKTQVPAGATAGVLRYESFSGVAVAMGTSAAAPAMTSPTAPPNTAPLQARLAPQGSRTIPPARKRSATESLDGPPSVVITKSQPVGSGLSGLTNATTSQQMSRQASKRSAIPPRSTPPQSQLPSPPSVSHHHGISHGHVSSSGLTPHNTSLLTPLSTATPSTTQGVQSSGSKRHQGGVQLSRQLVSRAAAVPAPLNPNYNCVGVAKGGVYYLRDKDPYPYHQRRQDEKGKEPEMGTSAATTLVLQTTLPVRPLPKQPFSSDKQPAKEDVAGTTEGGGKPSVDDNDDDRISCLSYIDSPDSAIGVHPDLGSLSFAEDDDIAFSDGGDPLLVYIDDNFDSSDEGEEFVKSVSPMRYARPGSAGTVVSADDGGSDISSDFFSDVDDPFKYNKGRSKRRGRTRTTVPVGLGGTGGTPNETAGVGARGLQSHKEPKEKPGIRMTGSLGSMRDLIESKAAKEKRKKEAEAAADAGSGDAIAARTKSAERDRALPQRYGHPQESPLPPPPPRLMWFSRTEASSSKVSLNQGAEGGAVASTDKLISPVSMSSSQGGSLSPMRYAKRMSVELLDDTSSLGSPISPIAGVGGLLKGKQAKSTGERRKKRSQPWSYQFDYQAAKASSPFTFGMGGEKAVTAVEEKELSKREEEKKKAEEGKKREKAKSLRSFKTKEDGEGRKKMSIDVLDISLLRRSSQPTLLEPGASTGGDDVFGLDSGGGGGGGGGGGSGGGSGGSGQQTFRTWDDSPASSATASSFTVIAADDVVITPPAHSPPPPIATSTSPPSSIGRTRTFKVRNP